MNNTYIFDKLSVYFKHTDYYGFVHPYNYFEWTSYVREDFFSKMCGDFCTVLNSPIKMMTSKISAEIKGDSKFGDEIEARFTIGKIKRVSLDVVVRFFNRNSKQIVCKTYHTLVFVDNRTQKISNIPKEIKNSIEKYQE